jgi:NADH dehydrogenase [ubiquinone] 1 alpha subcomplex assembly factor 7
LTSLAERLARRIARGGPITVADYMAAALADPEHGYYRTAAPIGAEGDFTTAPEISQMFGELIGAWLIDCWEKAGRPDPVRLIELGPGRGVLMEDALRVGQGIAAWRRAVDLHLVEINPALREAQAARLAAYAPRWHGTLSTAPDGPTLLVANEFFDALPIRQLMFRAGFWRERLIGWNEAKGFHFILSPAPSALSAMLPPGLDSARDGDLVELSPSSLSLTADIARRVSHESGAALIIDYGRTDTTPGETLRGMRRHHEVDMLADTGLADLSAHVDFAALYRAAREAGATIFGPVSQGQFLNELGIRQRADALKAKASQPARVAINDAVERLTGAWAMGDLFKALCMASPSLIPAGFSAARSNGGQPAGVNDCA